MTQMNRTWYWILGIGLTLVLVLSMAHWTQPPVQDSHVAMVDARLASLEAKVADLARTQLQSDHRYISNLLYELQWLRDRRPLTHMERHWMQRLTQEQQDLERKLRDLK